MPVEVNYSEKVVCRSQKAAERLIDYNIPAKTCHDKKKKRTLTRFNKNLKNGSIKKSEDKRNNRPGTNWKSIS